MNKEKFRCHPTIMLEGLLKFGWVILLLIVNNIRRVVEAKNNLAEGINFFNQMGIWGILSIILLVAALLVIILIQIRKWYKTWIRMDATTLVIERDTLLKKKNTIGIGEISNITLQQNLLEQALHTCKVKIDTNSMTTAQNTDVQIVISKEMGEAFKKELLHRRGLIRKEFEEIQEEEKVFDKVYSPKEVLIHVGASMTIFQIISFIIVAGGIVAYIVYKPDKEFFLQTILPYLGGLLAIFYGIISSVISSLYKLSEYYNMRLKRYSDKIIIERGLLNKKKFEIPLEKVNGVKVLETAISRVLGYRSVEVVNIGMGASKGETAQLILSGKDEDVEELMSTLLPEFVVENGEMIKNTKGQWTLFSLYNLITLVVCCFLAIGVMVIFGNVSETYAPWILWGSIGTAGGLTLFFGLTRLLKYLNARLEIGEEFLRVVTGAYTKTTHIMNYKKIQMVKTKTNPILRRWQMERGELYLLANEKNRKIVTHFFPSMYFGQVKEKVVDLIKL